MSIIPFGWARGYQGATFGPVDYGLIWFAAEKVPITYLRLCLRFDLGAGSTAALTIVPFYEFVIRLTRVKCDPGSAVANLLVRASNVASPQIVETFQTYTVDESLVDKYGDAVRCQEIDITVSNASSSSTSVSLTLFGYLALNFLSATMFSSLRYRTLMREVTQQSLLYYLVSTTTLSQAEYAVKGSIYVTSIGSVVVPSVLSSLESSNVPWIGLYSPDLSKCIIVVPNTASAKTALSGQKQLTFDEAVRTLLTWTREASLISVDETFRHIFLLPNAKTITLVEDKLVLVGEGTAPPRVDPLSGITLTFL